MPPKGGKPRAPARPRAKPAPRRSRKGVGMTQVGAGGPVVNNIVKAPVRTGREFSSPHMSMDSNRVQRNSEAGRCPAVRISGTDLSSYTVPAAQIGSTNGLSNNGSLAAVARLGPAEISARLSAIAGTYSWYAFRELDIELVSTVGTNSIAGSTSIDAGALYGFCITQNASSDDAVDGPLTLQQVSEVDPSCVTQIWRGGSLSYRYDGTKVWATSTRNSGAGAATYMQIYQVNLNAQWFSAPQISGSPLGCGIFRIRYVIDLYRPQEPSVSLSVRAAAPSELIEMVQLAQKRLRFLAGREHREDDEKDETYAGLDPPVLIRAPPPSPVASRRGSRPPGPR